MRNTNNVHEGLRRVGWGYSLKQEKIASQRQENRYKPIRLSSYSWPLSSFSFSYNSFVSSFSFPLLAHYIIEFGTTTVSHPSCNLNLFYYLIPTWKTDMQSATSANVFGQQEHNEKSKRELYYQSGHVTLQTLRYILPSCQQLNSNARLFSREGCFLEGGNMRHHRLYPAILW